MVELVKLDGAQILVWVNLNGGIEDILSQFGALLKAY